MIKTDCKYTPSYWLLCDDRLPLCSNPKNLQLFKAYLKHALLFNPKLVVPDSYIINNLNFRRSIRSDESIRQLMSDQIMKIAARQQGHGSEPSLVKTRNKMPDSVKPGEFTLEEYHCDLELEVLDTSAQFIPFSIQDISHNYTVAVKELFKRPQTEILIPDKNLLTDINLHIEEEILKSGKVGRGFFYYDIAKKINIDAWTKYQKVIHDIATGPYLKAIPHVIGADPVYAKEHKNAFDIMNNRQREKLETYEKVRFQSQLGLHSFVEGISLLDRDSILTLMDSEEAQYFQSCLHAENLENPIKIKELQTSLLEYQWAIENLIINKFYYLKSKSIDGNERIIENSFSEVTSTIGDTITFLTTAFTSLSDLSLSSILFTKPIIKTIEKKLNLTETSKSEYLRIKNADRDESRDRVLEELMYKKDVRIKAEMMLSSNSKETLYK